MIGVIGVHSVLKRDDLPLRSLSVLQVRIIYVSTFYLLQRPSLALAPRLAAPPFFFEAARCLVPNNNYSPFRQSTLSPCTNKDPTANPNTAPAIKDPTNNPKGDINSQSRKSKCRSSSSNNSPPWWKTNCPPSTWTRSTMTWSTMHSWIFMGLNWPLAVPVRVFQAEVYVVNSLLSFLIAPPSLNDSIYVQTAPSKSTT
jgi:hypothetical protein